MTEQLPEIAQMLLWSRFGLFELVFGLIVGLLFLAFALPAKLHGGTDEATASRDPAELAGPRRR